MAESLNDAHRLAIKYLLQNPVVDKRALEQLCQDAIAHYGVEDADFDRFVASLIQALSTIHMDLRSLWWERSGHEHFIMVNTSESTEPNPSHLPLKTREYFKAIVRSLNSPVDSQNVQIYASTLV